MTEKKTTSSSIKSMDELEAHLLKMAQDPGLHPTKLRAIRNIIVNIEVLRRGDAQPNSVLDAVTAIMDSRGVSRRGRPPSV